MIQPNSILLKLIISERATEGVAKLNQYTFKVSPEANKISVRQAVEAAFKGTKVAWVNIVNTKAKAKRILTRRGGYGIRLGFKKAVVRLKDGKIELN